jgi:hypothetical protein
VIHLMKLVCNISSSAYHYCSSKDERSIMGLLLQSGTLLVERTKSAYLSHWSVSEVFGGSYAEEGCRRH